MSFTMLDMTPVPIVGTAMVTKFEILCDHWVDEGVDSIDRPGEGSTVLSYTFSTIVAGVRVVLYSGGNLHCFLSSCAAHSHL